jgi:SAM-dependent methyltransferase
MTSSLENIKLWDQIFQNQEWGKYPSVPVIRFIARNFYKVANRKDIKILEIGSGTGANLWFCAKEGFSVFALDGSETAINRMKDRFLSEDLSEYLLKSYVGDYFETLDMIDDESIDAIIDAESLYCNGFDRSKKIIEKCVKKLKDNGVMMSLTFAEGTVGLVGEEIDYHAVFPTEGPMAGKGYSRYTTRDDIYKIYQLKNNVIERIERQEYFYSEMDVIKEWVIEFRKI